ncbi:MAG: hypothetical protein FWD40_10215 [Treponema sp.]|nr:hypothetical protein [Treponema sp.]
MELLEGKKENLSKILSEQYSQNIINIEEYERILEYINKIETNKELYIIEKIIYENNINKNLSVNEANKIIIHETKEKHLSIFSWRTNNLKSINGNGGKYLSIFGANRILVNDLPRGRTVLNVKSIFGLTEVIVPKNVKIINKTIPILAGIFSPPEVDKKEEDSPELYIIGKAIFGNITIMTAE